MILTISIKQTGKKDKIITTPLQDISTAPLDTLRKVWEVEQLLNSLPGTNIRVHVHVSEE